MSIWIHKEKCIGCGRCESVCPGTLIALEEGHAQIKYPKDCWGCVSCVKECPVEAISFFLGADIGGCGSTMTVTTEGDIKHWKIKKRDGTMTVIDVNGRDSNKY